MLELKNTYDDRVLTVVSRNTTTGQDGPSVDIAPGAVVEIEVDGEFHVAVHGPARQPGELPPESHPVATAPVEKVELIEADDDQVRAELTDMISAKTGLSKAGVPEMGPLNHRLKEKGFAPIKASRRGELMPEPA